MNPPHKASPKDANPTVTVVAGSTRGLVEVHRHGARLQGRLGRSPRRLYRGDEVHLLLQEPSLDVADARPGRVALLGRVEACTGGGRRCELVSGAQLELSVLMLVRDGVNVPLASVFGERPQRAGPTPPAPASKLRSLPPLDHDEEWFVEQTSTVSVTSLIAERPAAPVGMRGELSAMSLVDLVQAFELCRKTVKISLGVPADRSTVAEVFIVQGRVVHAAFNDLTGADAFVELAQLEEGTYTVRFEARAATESIAIPSAFLVMDALRQIDEERRLEGEATATRIAPPPAPLTGLRSFNL